MSWLKSGLWWLLVLVLVLLGILLGVNNSEMVRLRWLSWESPALPVLVWVMLSLMAGIAIGAWLAWLRMMFRAERKKVGTKPDKYQP